MPEPLNKAGGEGEVKDIFESSPAVSVQLDIKNDTDTDKGKPAEVAPEIKALQDQIAKLSDDKKSMSDNLIAQGKLIEDLRKGKNFDKDGKPTDVVDEKDIPVPYKKEEIKFSKDLTEDERDAMTKTEIALFDQLADMKVKANEKAINDFKKEQEMVKNNEKNKEVTDLNSKVKEIALTLANNDPTKANEIIESAKRFNLAGLDEATLKTRIEDAQKLLPDYVPPKEQRTITNGGTVVKENGTKEDPFGSTKIIEQVNSNSKGTYAL